MDFTVTNSQFRRGMVNITLVPNFSGKKSVIIVQELLCSDVTVARVREIGIILRSNVLREFNQGFITQSADFASLLI